MSMSNRERIHRALDLLREGLAPYIERELHSALNKGLLSPATLPCFAEEPKLAERPLREWDVAALLELMRECWDEVFAATLGEAQRSLVFELCAVRNRWAQQGSFASDDTDRALDSMERLLRAISSPASEPVGRLKFELRRQMFEEQARSERRRLSAALENPVPADLPPWREIVTPHPDVTSGRYQEAEFAADLAEVQAGNAGPEYQDSREFFRRTYLTEALRRLLINAMRRLAGQGGDPVIQLQISFGGGKTHALLALYHLTSGRPVGELPGVDVLMAEAQIDQLPRGVRRAVLVGTRLSPGQPQRKADGTVVRTLWGELAWQLGGPEGYALVREADESATNSGQALFTLLRIYQPALLLIDEWVAYARQLHDEVGLPGGTFETQFTFAQALTEAVRAGPTGVAGGELASLRRSGCA